MGEFVLGMGVDAAGAVGLLDIERDLICSSRELGNNEVDMFVNGPLPAITPLVATVQNGADFVPAVTNLRSLGYLTSEIMP
jgi:hypothetical protein